MILLDTHRYNCYARGNATGTYHPFCQYSPIFPGVDLVYVANSLNGTNSGPSSSFWAIFLYMSSVRIVSLVPVMISSPECLRKGCWNMRMLPIFGLTSSRDRLEPQKVVAPPFNATLESWFSVSFRYKCSVNQVSSDRSGVSYLPSQWADGG
jgi:hypothetical protein